MKIFFKAFPRHLLLQFKMDIRERGTLLTYYLLPLVFYFIVGSVFVSINPASKQTLAFSMAIFAVTMGAVLGMPVPIVKMREAEVLRAYRVCGIPGFATLLVHAVSAFLHLLIVSVIILTTAPIVFGAGIPDSYAACFAVLVIVLFCNIAIGLLIGVTAKNQSTATLLAQAVFLPTVMLGGIMFPATMLPGALRTAGYIIPSTHAVRSFSGLAFGMNMESGAVLSLLILAGIGAAAAIVAALRFKAVSRA
ncbi:MAG TPA: ABC transporter permease [Clostridia bacterium]|nr:ABC transporter permease [Clostridia bacterium]